MYRKILVPLDGSLFGESALPLAVSLARRAGAVIELIEIMPPLGAIYSDAPLSVDSELEQQLHAHDKAQHQAYLKDLAKRLGEFTPMPVQTVLLEGDIPTLLRTHAVQAGVDLVVMTTHARGPMGRFWLGSVADELVRKLPLPLLLLRPEGEPPQYEPEPLLRHILIPLDGQPLAEQILEPALALGRLMDADYTLLRVIKTVLPVTYPLEGISLAQAAESLIERTEDLQRALRQEARTYLDKVAVGLRERGFRVTTRVEVEDKPALAVLHQAVGADLVAMSTHGRGGLSRLFLGSVADKVIRGCHLPVLVQKPVEAKK